MTDKKIIAIMAALIIFGIICAMISASGDSWLYCVGMSGIENCQTSSDPLANLIIPFWNSQMGYGGSE